jgi:hypothetical protein
MSRRRSILALLLAVCAVWLSACAGFPTSGPLNYGLSADDTGDESQNVAFLPSRPQPGATPAQIVEGFINAGSGPGVAGDWSRAKEFLAPELQGTWLPKAGVTIDMSSERTYAEPAEGLVNLTVDAVATVDDRGAYERAEVLQRTLGFELAKQSDGEWRITKAPDGIVLDRDQFPTVFHRYSVMYFDPTWQYLVPDVRWFPTTSAAESITFALANQPASDWLADSVVSAFPENVSAVPSTTGSSGVVEIELSREALEADQQSLDRMLTQLEVSLQGAGVSDVVLSVGSAPLPAEVVPVRSTRVPSTPLVLAGGEFGFLTAGEVEPIPGLSRNVAAAAPVAVQVGPDRDDAAARLASGEVVRITVDGIDPLDARPGLVDPTIDPFGVVWSVPREQPSALQAHLPGGEVVDVADAWSEVSAIAAMSVSRDGTRVAAAVTAGGRTALWIAGVVRDADGVPQRLGPPVQLSIVGAPALGVAWIDDLTVGVLGAGQDESIVLEQIVGGPTSTSTASADMTSIAGGGGISNVRLRASDGTLYVRRGTSWQPSATDVLVLATQQGVPR